MEKGKKVIVMKTFKKYMSLVLCACVSVYTLPVFAYATFSDASNVKVELTDAQMGAAVGGNGNVDVTMADYTKEGGVAKAVLANRTTVSLQYTMDVVDSSGVVLENLVQSVGHSLDPDTAIMISGKPTSATAQYIRVRAWNSGVPGLESIDSSAAP